jgi:anti-sigma regulatory factor (Ser/Thr protein kinase)
MKEASVDLAPLALSASRARSLVRDFLADIGDQEMCENVQLVVSELVTNAVLYATSPIRLVLRLDANVLRVEVHDGSRLLPRVKHNALEAVTGRGLHIVGHYAERWGSDNEASGKSVWCEVRTEGEGTASCLERARAPARL